MAVQDTVEDDHCDHIEKHEGSSEHRDESKLEKSSGTSRLIKNFGKGITNIETDQNSGKVVTNVETGQNLEKWSRRSRWTSKTQAEEQNELRNQKLEEGILKEFVMNLLMDQKLEH